MDASTVTLLNITGGKSNDKKIYWEPPKTPNGVILAYKAKLIRDDESVIFIFIFFK